MASRKTNRELVTEFAELLTEGAKRAFAGDTGEWTGEDAEQKFMLEATKEWRADLWRKLKEIEERLCPVPPGT